MHIDDNDTTNDNMAYLEGKQASPQNITMIASGPSAGAPGQLESTGAFQT